MRWPDRRVISRNPIRSTGLLGCHLGSRRSAQGAPLKLGESRWRALDTTGCVTAIEARSLHARAFAPLLLAAANLRACDLTAPLAFPTSRVPAPTKEARAPLPLAEIMPVGGAGAVGTPGAGAGGRAEMASPKGQEGIMTLLSLANAADETKGESASAMPEENAGRGQKRSRPVADPHGPQKRTKRPYGSEIAPHGENTGGVALIGASGDVKQRGSRPAIEAPMGATAAQGKPAASGSSHQSTRPRLHESSTNFRHVSIAYSIYYQQHQSMFGCVSPSGRGEISLDPTLEARLLKERTEWMKRSQPHRSDVLIGPPNSRIGRPPFQNAAMGNALPGAMMQPAMAGGAPYYMDRMGPPVARRGLDEIGMRRADASPYDFRSFAQPRMLPPGRIGPAMNGPPPKHFLQPTGQPPMQPPPSRQYAGNQSGRYPQYYGGSAPPGAMPPAPPPLMQAPTGGLSSQYLPRTTFQPPRMPPPANMRGFGDAAQGPIAPPGGSVS